MGYGFDKAVFSLLFILSAWASASEELPRRIRQILEEQVVPAMIDGDDLRFYDTFGSIIQKADGERIEAIEAFAVENQLPSLSDHFVDIKLKRIEFGFDAVDKNQNLRESIFLVDGINRRLQQFVDDVSSHAIMQDPLRVPDDWKDSRDMFWEAHVFKNDFANNFRLIEFGLSSLLPLKKSILRSADDRVLGTAKELESLAGSLPELQRELIEREAELRLIRFNRGIEELAAAQDFESKFIAAMSIEVDSEVLIPLLTNTAPGTFTRAALLPPGLLADLTARLTTARRSDESITTKAQLFREGMHWWLRGRYGMASMASGLLKPPAAMHNDFVMNALYMPRVRPDPIQPVNSEGGNTRGYDRRHYYTWAVEYRPLVTYRTREKIRGASQTEHKTLSETKPQIRNNQSYFL